MDSFISGDQWEILILYTLLILVTINTIFSQPDAVDLYILIMVK